MQNMTSSGIKKVKRIDMNNKKPGFFKRWLFKQLQDARNYDSIVLESPQAISRDSHSIEQSDRSIHFTVYTANGGKVVETKKYDRQKDRHNHNLYIVTNDQEFGREIDKIITMESLR